jgi:hypothetical protein
LYPFEFSGQILPRSARLDDSVMNGSAPVTGNLDTTHFWRISGLVTMATICWERVTAQT